MTAKLSAIPTKLWRLNYSKQSIWLHYPILDSAQAYFGSRIFGHQIGAILRRSKSHFDGWIFSHEIGSNLSRSTGLLWRLNFAPSDLLNFQQIYMINLNQKRALLPYSPMCPIWDRCFLIKDMLNFEQDPAKLRRPSKVGQSYTNRFIKISSG